MYAKLSKCSFMQIKVNYLKHIISSKGVSTDLKKVQMMKFWPNPSFVQELRSFLSVTSYYKKFIRNYDVISKPLTNQSKKDAFQWEPAAQQAFEVLKQRTTKAPILTLLDFSKTFVVETNASNMEMGAMLQQQKHPIAFISKAFGPIGQELSVYEKELLAITFVVSKWRHYLEQGYFSLKLIMKALNSFWNKDYIRICSIRTYLNC